MRAASLSAGETETGLLVKAAAPRCGPAPSPAVPRERLRCRSGHVVVDRGLHERESDRPSHMLPDVEAIEFRSLPDIGIRANAYVVELRQNDYK